MLSMNTAAHNIRRQNRFPFRKPAGVPRIEGSELVSGGKKRNCASQSCASDRKNFSY